MGKRNNIKKGEPFYTKNDSHHCILTCDSVGIQTQDLQNRNLTLYSAKLRDLKPICGYKGNKFYEDCKDEEPKSE